MAEESGGQSFLIGLLITTLVLGLLVLIAKTDYRIEQIALSNEDYYPTVEVTRGTD
jgi:hypothetical protein